MAQMLAEHCRRQDAAQRRLPFLDDVTLPTRGWFSVARRLPPAVREALAFYFEQIEKKDIGVVRLHQPTLNGEPVYVVCATTDGDDGWIELYDARAGGDLGVARTYLELVAWGEKKMLRAQTETGAFPPELALEKRRRFWRR